MTDRRPDMTYGLRWNPNPPLTVPQFVAYALATGVYTILAWISVVSGPIQIPGVGALFIAMGFGVPFCMWFGGWGLVMGFIGTTIGAGVLTGLPLPISLAFGVGDLILFGSLLILYRGLSKRFGVDPIGRDVFTLKGFIFFFIIGANIPHLLGAIYGTWLLYTVGFVPGDAVVITFFGFWIGNVIVVTVISPILLRLLGPVVERFGLTNYGWLT
jgi:integral membrane sensor domain MASE1